MHHPCPGGRGERTIFMTQTKVAAVLGIIALLLAAVAPARAADGDEQEPYVVLVGIDKYPDTQILPHPHAVADAQALYDVFANKDYSGTEASHVRLLLSTPDEKRHSQPATRDNILESLRWAAANATRNSLVVFAYIGQGAPLGERDCYFAVDSTFTDRAKNALAAADIEHVLEKMKSHRFCVFLDVNFKGFDVGKESAPDANLPNFYREFFGIKDDEAAEKAKGEHTSMAGRILFLANDGRVPSVQLADHGAFAKVLVDGLKGGADKEGYEPDGVVTVEELVEYVNKQLPELARTTGKTRAEKEQRDYIVGSRSAHYVITHNPAAAAKVKARLDAFEKVAVDRELSQQLTEEGRKLLGRMPKLEAQRQLRKNYQKLVDGTLEVDDFVRERARIFDDSKMKRSAARDYAAKVIQASEVIKRDYVKDVNQGELVASAIKGLYQRIDEKIPPEIKKRLDDVKEMSEEELTSLVADAREHLGNREDLDNHKDLDFALQRLTAPLDPYTTYIDPETLAQFKRETAGNFVGIGIQIRMDSARDMLLVVTPIKGSPAYKAGLKAGDIITTITREVDSNGKRLETPEVISTKGISTQDAVKKIVGKAGTKVKLTVDREGVDHPLEFEVTRGLVEVESVLGVHRKPDDSWDFVIDPESKICYVRLTSFARNTARDLARVMQYLQETVGVKGLILDLRFNPGGLLTSAVEISDMFIDDGLIVTIKPRQGREAAYTGEHEGSMLDFPMVCLVNGHSASGSEIVSACLQDHRRAVIMGERSYGKGSVQNIQPFEEGELKLTTASFWRPSGKNLNKSSTTGKESDTWGVTPDAGYTIKLSRKERDELEDYLHKQEIIPRHDVAAKEEPKPYHDVQLDAAVKYLRDQIRIASRATAKRAG
jgi:C-terminal peptidase prc